MNKVLSALKKLRWKVLMTMEKKLLPPHFCYCSSNLSFKLSLSLFFSQFWCAGFLIAGRQRNAADRETQSNAKAFFELTKHTAFWNFTQFYPTIPESFGSSLC